jgi:sterol desaturase/sphingolipid hydroxylase (fatty acid hydroxylase superfamily)
MRILRSPFTAAVTGAAWWTATEYGLHRFAMHEPRGTGLPSVEHLKHHADVTTFARASNKIASAAAATAVIYPVTAARTSRRWAASFTTGFITMYFGYEIAHRRTHTHPPRNRYGRWTRRNHLHHHFGAPMRNYGVTVPVWDRVFGTYDEPGVVTIPRRMTPAWMLDDDGEIRAEFANDYITKGARRLDALQIARDRADAFANVAPER